MEVGVTNPGEDSQQQAGLSEGPSTPSPERPLFPSPIIYLKLAPFKEAHTFPTAHDHQTSPEWGSIHT